MDELDVVTGAIEMTIPFPPDADSGAFISPDNSTAYFLVDAPVGAPQGTEQLVGLSLSSGSRTDTAITIPPTAPNRQAGGGFIQPTAHTFSANGTTLYLTDAASNQVVVLDLSDDHLSARIPVQSLDACGDTFAQLAATPDGDDLYVDGLGRFSDIDLTKETDSSVFSIPGSDTAEGDPAMSLTPDGKTLWTIQSGDPDDTLIPIDTDGDVGGAGINVPTQGKTSTTSPAGDTSLTIDPAWDSVYAPQDNRVLVISLGSQPPEVIPVDPATGQVRAGIPLTTSSEGNSCGTEPMPMAITGGGEYAVVASQTSATVHVVDLTTGTVGDDIPIGTKPASAILVGNGYSTIP